MDYFTLQDPLQFEIEARSTSGYCNARDLKGYRGVQNTLVRLTFVGYDTAGEPVYVFVHQPESRDPYLPPHDHRSNNPADGGFAFAVYSPGTSLPQQPWAR